MTDKKLVIYLVDGSVARTGALVCAQNIARVLADQAKVVLVVPKCSIPDDHIDPRRSAFFMARSVFEDIRKEKRDARSTA